MTPSPFEHVWNLLVNASYSASFWPEAVLLILMLAPWAVGLAVRTSRAGESWKWPALRWGLGAYLYTRLVADFALWGPIVGGLAALATGILLARKSPGRSAGAEPIVIVAGAAVASALSLTLPSLLVSRLLVCAVLAGVTFATPPVERASEPSSWMRPAGLLWVGLVLGLGLNGLNPRVYLPLVLVGVLGWLVVGFELWRKQATAGKGRWGRRILSATAWVATTFLCLTAVFEVYFRYVYDTSDAYTGLQTYKLWWDRHVRLNSWGYRDREYEPVSQFDDHLRVAVLGDSFAFGQGIDREEDLLSRRIERELTGRLPQGRVVSAFNLAHGGIATVDQLDIFEGVEPRLKPQVVVLAYMLNDVGDGTEFRAVNHPALDPWRTVMKASVGLDFIIWRAYTAFFMENRGKPLPELTYFANQDIWGRHRAHIDALVQAVRDSGSELVVVVYPFLRLPAFADLQQQGLDQVLAVFAEHGIPAIDVSTVVDVTDPQYVVNGFDPHPNERLHQTVAPLVADAIIARLETLRPMSDGTEVNSPTPSPATSQPSS